METRTRAEYEAIMQNARTGVHPEHWPSDVEMISLEGLAALGLDRKGNLYLDGERVYTAKRLAGIERGIAIAGVAAAVLAAVATGFSAYADMSQMRSSSDAISTP